MENILNVWLCSKNLKPNLLGQFGITGASLMTYPQGKIILLKYNDMKKKY